MMQKEVKLHTGLCAPWIRRRSLCFLKAQLRHKDITAHAHTRTHTHRQLTELDSLSSLKPDNMRSPFRWCIKGVWGRLVITWSSRRHVGAAVVRPQPISSLPSKKVSSRWNSPLSSLFFHLCSHLLSSWSGIQPKHIRRDDGALKNFHGNRFSIILLQPHYLCSGMNMICPSGLIFQSMVYDCVFSWPASPSCTSSGCFRSFSFSAWAASPPQLSYALFRFY